MEKTNEIQLSDVVRQEVRSSERVLGIRLADFESALETIEALWTKQPDSYTHSYSVTSFAPTGTQNLQTCFVAFIDDQESFLEAMRFTLVLKSFELAQGICSGLNSGAFRVAALCCRTLLEEAVTANYYIQQASASSQDIVEIAPSTFREARLLKMHREDPAAFQKLLDRFCISNKQLRRWQAGRRMDFEKPHLFKDHELDKDDPLFQTNVMTTMKKIHLFSEEPASFWYALLCEATHPNVGSYALYVDTASEPIDGNVTDVLRKERKSSDLYQAALNIVCKPMIGTMHLIEEVLFEIDQTLSRLRVYRKRLAAL